MKNKGFTLIELLVVISIIGLMASVVLASVTVARAKAADATIKQNLDGIRIQSHLYFEAHHDSFADVQGLFSLTTAAPCFETVWMGTYYFFDDPKVWAAVEAAQARAGGVSMCNVDPWGWVVYVPLNSDPSVSWCVDSTGISKPIATPLPDVGSFATNCE